MRSGKSKYAEELAVSRSHTITDASNFYIATAQALDSEMEKRIQRHQDDRASDQQTQRWQTIEEPIQLGSVLTEYSESNHIVLIDCLTLWLTNLICAENPKLLEQEKQLFLAAFQESNANIIMVSNEIGFGIVPMGELSRRFADEAGFLHQSLAKLCDQVYLTVAGIPTKIK